MPPLPPATVATVECPTPTASVLHVRSGASGGSGAATAPFGTVQAAVDAAKVGDVIRVAQGTYNEAVTIRNKEVHLCGGYTADFASRPGAAMTTSIVGSAGAPVVRLMGARRTSLIGFRVTGGAGGVEITGTMLDGMGPLIAGNLIEANARAGTDSRGGGLYVTDSDARIVNNVIRANTAGRGGGIASSRTGAFVIQGNEVLDNIGLGDHGGGLYVLGANVLITRNRISGNVIGRMAGYGWGGGLIVLGPASSVVRLSHNIVTKNVAPTNGSGEFIDGEPQSVTIEHDVVYGNACPEFGGAGIYVDGGNGITRATFINVTVADHPCPNVTNGGNGIYASQQTAVTVKNSIFWNNGKSDFYLRAGSTLDVSYTLSQTIWPGTGNIRVDPLFADAANADYHLRSKAGRFVRGGMRVRDAEHSPAIDVGDPASDFSAEPAPNGGRVDLGAYGNTEEASLSER